MLKTQCSMLEQFANKLLDKLKFEELRSPSDTAVIVKKSQKHIEKESFTCYNDKSGFMSDYYNAGGVQNG